MKTTLETEAQTENKITLYTMKLKIHSGTQKTKILNSEEEKKTTITGSTLVGNGQSYQQVQIKSSLSTRHTAS